MIPDLPASVTDSERLDFLSTLWGNLSDQSSVHVNWHTHRQNPSVCWICDLFNLTSRVLEIATKNNTKSSLDMVTKPNSDEESDLEIENDSSLNYNEEDTSNTYNEPEYDVVEDDTVESD